MKQRPQIASARTPESADALVDSLEELPKHAVQVLRRVILESDPSISEGIKWNALSFRTREYFATVNVRAKEGIGLILHFGAKKNSISEGGVTISDPEGLLRWLAKDRAMVTFRDADELAAKRAALQALVREWIQHVE